jgi:hypothetical protein
MIYIQVIIHVASFVPNLLFKFCRGTDPTEPIMPSHPAVGLKKRWRRSLDRKIFPTPFLSNKKWKENLCPPPPPIPHSAVSKTIYAGLTKGGRYIYKGVYGPPGINQVYLSLLLTGFRSMYLTPPPPLPPLLLQSGEFAIRKLLTINNSWIS